jgi:DNA helicase-2/ATP-dependent DNA helicase PcrA
MPCTLCPKGYLHRLPCPRCDCEVAQDVPMPMCGDTRNTVPCLGCERPCAFSERAQDIEDMVINQRWWNGNPEEWVWGDPPSIHTSGEHHLDGLNEDQLQVAKHTDGPCVVIAGAGSGKTRSVVARIQNLIREQKVDPNEILAITFTRKAANEMKERTLASLDEDEGKGLQIRTFHSAGVRVCRAHTHMLGIRERFSIWDEDAAARQLKIGMKDIVEKSDDPGRKRAYTPKKILGFLNSWKERGLELNGDFWKRFEGGSIDDLKETFIHLGNASELNDLHTKIGSAGKGNVDNILGMELDEITRTIRRYENLKRVVGALDLADLIWLPVIKARQDSELRDSLGSRWSYIIVDEYQDTNDLQEEMIELLGGEHKNVMVVGDDDQSIYGWRGSNVNLITGFQRRWSGARMIRLGQNYRCRPEIVQAADASIRHNNNRVPKQLWSEREGGGSVRVTTSMTPWDEASSIRRCVTQWLDQGATHSQIAVLSRRRIGVSTIAAELTRHHIPVDAVGVRPWFKQGDVVNVLSHLHYQLNPTDIDAAQEILAKWPGIGATTIARWREGAYGGSGVHLLDDPIERLLGIPRHGPKTKKGKRLNELRGLHQTLQAGVQKMTVKQACELLLGRLGIHAEIATALETGVVKKAQEAERRKESIESLLQCAEACKEVGLNGLEELSENISTLVSIQTSSTERVTISTIHSAKGLEWDKVIVMGLNQGVFPVGENIQEERRLFYVALTRAKNDLVMTYSMHTRNGYGELQTSKPSQFIKEAAEAGTIEGNHDHHPHH